MKTFKQFIEEGYVGREAARGAIKGSVYGGVAGGALGALAGSTLGPGGAVSGGVGGYVKGAAIGGAVGAGFRALRAKAQTPAQRKIALTHEKNDVAEERLYEKQMGYGHGSEPYHGHYAHPMHLHLKKGAFHRWLGKSEDEPITAADIEKGLKAGGHAAKMAQFARNAKHFRHGK